MARLVNDGHVHCLKGRMVVVIVVIVAIVVIVLP